MKTLHDKFKQRVNFVKPLYKKVKPYKRVKPMKKLFVCVDINDTELGGDGIYVKKGRVKNKIENVNAVKSEKYTEITLPGACDNSYRDIHEIFTDLKPIRRKFDYKYNKKKVIKSGNKKMDNKIETTHNSASIQADNSFDVIDKIPDRWLRVYPAEQANEEPVLSVILRCAMCQLGLAAFLILWTLTWIFVINFFEGPFETDVSNEFEKQQNQLVIDLATELRQITPVSPKWKNAIEKRIEDERKLTMTAVARGAKLHPGEFWNLSGTFLFTVYVMTALGFGAPVPQTMLGRTSALIYAALAVPTHIYLIVLSLSGCLRMISVVALLRCYDIKLSGYPFSIIVALVNASTCLVANVESNIDKIKNCFRHKNTPQEKSIINGTENANNCRNSELNKSPSKNKLRKNILWILDILSSGRCVPIATILYYSLGAISFGLLRGKEPLEIVMFPLEFTTTGGLEHVESYVRILYSFYVEGAMSLLACALATLRRHSSTTMIYLIKKYRLFSTEK